MGVKRGPSIPCPDCGRPLEVRTSEQQTRTCREVRLLCRDDDCGGRYIAQVEVVRIIAPSLRPHAGVRLPMWNARPANNNEPIPANDDKPAAATAPDDMLSG